MILNPAAVQQALDRMKSGDSSTEVFDVLVTAAEAYAAMTLEWGFEAPIGIPGLTYVTRNQLLAETMWAGRPEAKPQVRVAPEWQDPEAWEL